MRTLEGQAPTEHVYERLFADHDPTFWLDSADAPTWLAQCSYMGTTAGPDRCFVSYDVDSRRGRGQPRRRRDRRAQVDLRLPAHASWSGSQVDPPEGVDRGLVGGYVGYLGYELKADCGSPNVHSSDLPDAALMLANRVVAVDHTNDKTTSSPSAAVRTPRPSSGSTPPRS